MTNATEELRNRCRTCRYLALPEYGASSGYCWQCDKPVKLMTYSSFPRGYDPKCVEVTGLDDDCIAWEPLSILAPYFNGEVIG